MTAAHRLIDLGTGTGSFALQAARRCAQVHAVDVSRAMLDYARGKASAAGLKNIEFHRGGFLTYEHRADPADTIVTRFALHHLPDFWKMAGLLRMRDMLKSGGTLYLRDVVFSFEPSKYRSEVAAWIDRAAAPSGRGFTVADFESHVREEYSTYGWIIEGMLARVGFRIESAVYDDPTYAEYICSKIDIGEPVTRD